MSEISKFEAAILRHVKTEALAYLRKRGYSFPSPSHAPDTFIVEGVNRLYFDGTPYAGCIPQPGEIWRDEKGDILNLKIGAINIAAGALDEMIEVELHEVLHTERPRIAGFADKRFRGVAQARLEALIRRQVPDLVAKVMPGAILRLKASCLSLILDLFEKAGLNFDEFIDRHARSIFHLYHMALAIAEKFSNLNLKDSKPVQYYTIKDPAALRRQIIIITGYHFNRIADRVERAIRLVQSNENLFERNILKGDKILKGIIEEAYEIRRLKREKFKRLRDEPYGEF